jgi:hypothetical protein
MLIDRYHTSERKACALVGLSRTAWRYQSLVRDDDRPFRAEGIRLASHYGRYGYRMIAGLMRNVGWKRPRQIGYVASGEKKDSRFQLSNRHVVVFG